MADHRSIALLDEILEPWRATIGGDYDGYRNHAQRVARFCGALGVSTPDTQHKIAIAAAFHDLGIWSAGTLDYLPPSVALARDHLSARGLDAWAPEIERMILLHHRVRSCAGPGDTLVEALRRADLVDLSLGVIPFGLDRALVATVKDEFPNAGFHACLARLLGGWFRAHPMSLPPMLRW
ncbi:hypothetical protein K2Z84_09835 [Candidatus Binatia bacterium]|jgi:hypothetical protein|nr:hypothetical protein [Candidatus Binatia bacterium]